jgi:hypothetical protein
VALAMPAVPNARARAANRLATSRNVIEVMIRMVLSLPGSVEQVPALHGRGDVDSMETETFAIRVRYIGVESDGRYRRRLAH